jgi:hypothetical protein
MKSVLGLNIRLKKLLRGREEEVVVSCFDFHIYSVSEMNVMEMLETRA